MSIPQKNLPFSQYIFTHKQKSSILNQILKTKSQMKKTISIVALILVALFSNAQDSKLKVGINFGLPMGDFKDAYSFSAAVNANYLFPISEKFKLGATAGYQHYNGKTMETNILGYVIKTEVKSAGFIPLGATAEYHFHEKIYVGADLGYAIGIAPSSNNGGVYFQPKVAYKLEKTDVILGYNAIAVTGGDISSISLGAAIKL